MERYKIVDAFNGWEGNTQYNSRPEAEKALESERKAFFHHPLNRHCRFCKEIVPVTFEWRWDSIYNGFLWK